MSRSKLLQAVSHSSDDVSPLFSLKSFVLGRHWAALGTGATLHLVQTLALRVQASGRTWSASAGLMAALEMQVKSECRHLAALRVRVQGAKKSASAKSASAEN